MKCPGQISSPQTRRAMLQASANGFGLLALSALLSDESRAVMPAPHFRAAAKNVIFLFMDGGVSHVDSFDPKPKLDALDGKPFTTSANPTANGNRLWLKCPWKFQPRGKSGMPI